MFAEISTFPPLPQCYLPLASNISDALIWSLLLCPTSNHSTALSAPSGSQAVTSLQFRVSWRGSSEAQVMIWRTLFSSLTHPCKGVRNRSHKSGNCLKMCATTYNTSLLQETPVVGEYLCFDDHWHYTHKLLHHLFGLQEVVESQQVKILPCPWCSVQCTSYSREARTGTHASSCCLSTN